MPGRNKNKCFDELKFELIKQNNKYRAVCLVCLKILHNTAASRLKAHRNVCPLDNYDVSGSDAEPSTSSNNTQTGTDPESFCVGGDLKEMSSLSFNKMKRICCGRRSHLLKKDNNVNVKNDDNNTSSNSLGVNDNCEESCRIPNDKDHISEIDIESIKTEQDPLQLDLDKPVAYIDTSTSTSIQEEKGFSQTVNRVEEDEWDLFGRYVATQLKKLPDEVCIIAQDKIQRILTLHRLHALQSSGFSGRSSS